MLAGLIVVLSFIGTTATGQDVKVRAGFITDSIAIGDETPFYLSARYPSERTLLFPDSSYKFLPFEFQRKVYFPTNTANGISYDSAVYYLTTFEIDTIQSLSLPVYMVTPSDCTIFYSGYDSIYLDPLIAVIPDSMDARNLPLRTSVAYETVHYTFNYLVAYWIFCALAGIGISSWLLFGKKLKRHWIIRRMQKKYTQFNEAYSGSLERIKSDLSPLTAEATIIIWKKYLEELEKAPFTKLTTRETIKILKEPSLEQHMRSIDRAIYGGDTTNIEPFEGLRSFADKEFQKKLEEVRNG